MSKPRPRDPIYIPSKGRYDVCITAKFLIEDDVPFYLVIEKQEYEAYAEHYDEKHLLVLPFSNRGSVIPARNWIKQHATELGAKRHWQFDDNIRQMERWYKGMRIRCDANIAIAATEDFVDRFTNVAIAGMNYHTFAITPSLGPFTLNTRVYSCSLVLNELPHEWRGSYNEDTDLCLQVLSDGWCTLLVNAFLIDKKWTMSCKGGNTAELYQGDGRLKMARSLERLWPGVVETKRRFQRPQHVVKDSWKRFDTQLIYADGKSAADYDTPNEYGLKLKVREGKKVKSKELRSLLRRRKKAQA
jgi:hypothetical protein